MILTFDKQRVRNLLVYALYESTSSVKGLYLTIGKNKNICLDYPSVLKKNKAIAYESKEAIAIKQQIYNLKRIVIPYKIISDALRESDRLDSSIIALKITPTTIEASEPPYDIVYNEIVDEQELEDDQEKLPKGWINANNLLTIDYQRYWLLDKEMENVKTIQKEFPDRWKEIVLSKMRNRSL